MFDISPSYWTNVARVIPDSRINRAMIIFQLKSFRIKNRLKITVIGRTSARLIETRLGKIYVMPKIKHMFSKKSHIAGSDNVKKLTYSLACSFDGSYRR